MSMVWISVYSTFKNEDKMYGPCTERLVHIQSRPTHWSLLQRVKSATSVLKDMMSNVGLSCARWGFD